MTRQLTRQVESGAVAADAPWPQRQRCGASERGEARPRPPGRWPQLAMPSPAKLGEAAFIGRPGRQAENHGQADGAGTRRATATLMSLDRASGRASRGGAWLGRSSGRVGPRPVVPSAAPPIRQVARTVRRRCGEAPVRVCVSVTRGRGSNFAIGGPPQPATARHGPPPGRTFN